MITIVNEKGQHLTTDKHGLFAWTDDPERAIGLAGGASAARLARASGNLQEIQAHRGVIVHTVEPVGEMLRVTDSSSTQAVPLLPTRDEEGHGGGL